MEVELDGDVAPRVEVSADPNLPERAGTQKLIQTVPWHVGWRRRGFHRELFARRLSSRGLIFSGVVVHGCGRSMLWLFAVADDP